VFMNRRCNPIVRRPAWNSRAAVGPYRKNDQTWVEQTNGAVVRRIVGYRRYVGLAAAAGLDPAIYMYIYTYISV
jgi:hypothetical protein